MNSIQNKLKAYRIEIPPSLSPTNSFQSNWKDGLSGKKQSLNRIVDIVLCKGPMPVDEEACALSKANSNSPPSDASPFRFIDESTIATVASDLTDIKQEEYDQGLYDSECNTWSHYH